MKRNTVGLIGFLKGSTDPKAGMPGCSNYDHRRGGCLFGDDCSVEQGERCSYFERAVLPTATDIRTYSQYEALCGIGEPLVRREVRKCPDCGSGLRFRQRYCADCSRRRRRKSYRQSRQKKRGLSATVSENSPPNSAA
jgi:hypothetical protein